ncbi:MAG: secretin N-terminal domain-containing protein [Candidatus Omnitrophica bacterium]|nr:secretin N-terminal domain-containing protein [Candidatus Omnitrophota bacterium]
MKNKLRSCAIFVLFSLTVALPVLDAEQLLPIDNPDITISMDFKDASLKDILKLLSIQSGMNFIASEAITDRQMTLYFDKVPLQEAIDKIFSANSLSYDLAPESNVIIVKDMGKPEVEVETRVFYLKYASVSSSHIKEEVQSNIGSSGSSSGSTSCTGTSTSSSSSASSTSSTSSSTTGDRYAVSGDIGITTAIKKLMTKDGSVIEDYRTNSLVVQDIPAKMPVIAETIAKLDVPTPLIRIEVEMLDVSKGTTDKLGLRFGQSPVTMTLTGPTVNALGVANFPIMGGLDKWLDASTKSFTGGSAAFNPTGSTYSVVLDFLKTQSDTKYLARPTILTLNNETAEFMIKTTETTSLTTGAVATGANPITTQTLGSAETGIVLRVTPQVNIETGDITMFVMPKVTETSSSGIAVNGVTVLNPETRSTKSIVRVKDGETIILGGMLRNKRSETITKLPFFGDVPLIGGLFRNRTKDQDIERELMVFITPHIVKEAKTGLTKTSISRAANLPKLPDREQNTFSLADRQALIPNKMPAFEQKK